MATTETMSIAKLISEQKLVAKRLNEIVSAKQFNLISYYFDYNKFIGPLSIEDAEKNTLSYFDEFDALLIRFKALNAARVKANATTTVRVTAFISIKDVFNGKEVGEEEITIAEAILRKKYFVDVLSHLARSLGSKYGTEILKKKEFDEKAEEEVEKELDRKFPVEMKRNFTAKDIDEAKEKARKDNEVKILDPLKVADGVKVRKFIDMVNNYIETIDSALSEVNASTKVEFTY